VAGDYKTAAETLRKVLAANPELPGGWTLYGRALLNGNQNDDAKTAFQHALQIDANDFEANLYLGGMLRHDGDYQGAAPLLQCALRLRPDSVAARFQVGALDAALGHLEAARTQLEAVARQSPDFVEAHVQLAAVYARLKRTRDSERERQIVIALNAKARSKGPQPEQ
jgi:tetratricopeptide (TPR) repeat protein